MRVSVVYLQGLKASLLGAIPYSAVRLGSYDGLKWAYKRVGFSQLQSDAPSRPIPHIVQGRYSKCHPG